MTPPILMPCPASDSALLAAIHAACFAEPWDSSAIYSLMTSPGIIALRDSLAQGLVMVRIVADEGEILTLGVIPEQRRQGLAHQLMSAAQQQAWAKGATALFLEVAIDNQAALSLYEGLGYHRVGRRPRYYKRGKDAVDALVLRLQN